MSAQSSYSGINIPEGQGLSLEQLTAAIIDLDVRLSTFMEVTERELELSRQGLPAMANVELQAFLTEVMKSVAQEVSGRYGVSITTASPVVADTKEQVVAMQELDAMETPSSDGKTPGGKLH